jgi:hypothetical protein
MGPKYFPQRISVAVSAGSVSMGCTMAVIFVESMIVTSESVTLPVGTLTVSWLATLC